MCPGSPTKRHKHQPKAMYATGKLPALEKRQSYSPTHQKEPTRLWGFEALRLWQEPSSLADHSAKKYENGKSEFTCQQNLTSPASSWWTCSAELWVSTWKNQEVVSTLRICVEECWMNSHKFQWVFSHLVRLWCKKSKVGVTWLAATWWGGAIAKLPVRPVDRKCTLPWSIEAAVNVFVAFIHFHCCICNSHSKARFFCKVLAVQIWAKFEPSPAQPAVAPAAGRNLVQGTPSHDDARIASHPRKSTRTKFGRYGYPEEHIVEVSVFVLEQVNVGNANGEARTMLMFQTFQSIETFETKYGNM